MKKYTSRFAALAVLGFLVGCHSTPQLTSGADYLARYNDPAYQTTQATSTERSYRSTSLDNEVRAIASIEPNLQFPARIGLARIERGRLSGIPAEEGYMWQELAENLGSDFGEFVPVSAFVASTVALSGPSDQYLGRQDVFAHIRRGAARQHIDYVLVYEVTTQEQGKPNILSLGEATILGHFILPSRGLEVEAASSAILMDVRNGYPYATLTEYAERQGVARGFRKEAKERELAETASLKAVEGLVEEAEAVMHSLAIKAAGRLSAANTGG